MRRVHLLITGTVHGVGFRYAARAEALAHGLSGWVRNRHDGSVEAEVQGEASAVEEVLSWFVQGPEGAAVSGMDVTDIPVEAGTSFTIRASL